MVGIALFMGGETTPSRAVVHSAGHGYRISAAALKKKFEAGGALQYLLLRFTQALITQMTQTAVCNRHHALDQQLCRWLLLRLDRIRANELVITQELIANMLGMRREGVTEAAGKLQDEGAIEYRRGQRRPAPEKAEVAVGKSLATTTGAVPMKDSPSEPISAPLPAEEIYRMIRETAYFKAKARGFAPGVELQDWLEAEKEVRQRLEGAGLESFQASPGAQRPR